MLFLITGTADASIAQEVMKRALPVLKKHGAPVGHINTFALLPDAYVVDDEAEPIDDISPVTFYFPAFDGLRKEGKLQALADELAVVTEVPCHTLDAGVIAGFLPA